MILTVPVSFFELPLQEIIRYTKGSVREHNLLKNQFVHTKFLLNLFYLLLIYINHKRFIGIIFVKGLFIHKLKTVVRVVTVITGYVGP